MNYYLLQTLDTLTIAAGVDAPTLAWALGQLADLALVHGRANHAERLALKSASMREAAL